MSNHQVVSPPLSPDNIRREVSRGEHQREYTLSVGSSRKAVRWETVRLTWGAVVERLRTPVRTSETMEEYAHLSRDEQVERKDVGGYVAGELREGRRKRSALLYRSLLTLDMDSAGAPGEVYGRVRDAFPTYSFVLHSTHSHRPEAPRLRLVMPLDRDVSGEEYRALIRSLAEAVGAEEVDPTTDQGERLMFWPSVPRDAEYVVEEFAGVPLVADRWLRGEDAGTLVARAHASGPAEDPFQKRGVIGWFCRAFPIPRALEELLPGVYAPTGRPDRWTYADGHTTGGALIYDEGRYLYSYHATDPAEGRLLNAFDLVRIHKYGRYDVSSSPGTPVTSLPSYRMMCDFAKGRPEVEEERMKDFARQVARADFDTSSAALSSGGGAEASPVLTPGSAEYAAYDPTTDLEEMSRWGQELVYRTDKEGRMHFDNSHYNVILILENDRRIKDCFARDEFNERSVVLRDLPWRAHVTGVPDYVTDEDLSQLRSWLSSHYYRIDNRQVIDDAIVTVEMRHRYHPVRSYLRSLRWDGEERAERLLVRTMGAEDTQLTREITLKWLKAAVARIERPGTKFDCMLVLYGPTGCGKSTLLERLGRQWYSPTLVSLDNIRQASAQLQGCWIIEDPEMVGLMASGVANAKAFLSKSTDDFIAPYGRKKIYRKRQCVFAATTNETDFLRDHTGERRYWVVGLRKMAEEGEEYPLHPYAYLSPEVVDQIWAEVYARWQEEPSLVLTPESARALRRVQRNYRDIDVWEESIADFVALPAPLGYRTLPYDTLDGYYYNRQGPTELDSEALEERTVVSFDDICRWALGFRQEGRIPKDARKRVNAIMASLPEWENCYFKHEGKSKRGWRKKR